MVCKSGKRQNNFVINTLLIYFIVVIDKTKAQPSSMVLRSHVTERMA